MFPFFFLCLLIFQIWALVLEDHYNPRLVKELLQDLSMTLHNLTVHVGRSVLVGNINIWLCRLENIIKWQQQLNSLQIPKVEEVDRCICVYVCLYVCVVFVHPKSCFRMLWASSQLWFMAVVSTQRCMYALHPLIS